MEIKQIRNATIRVLYAGKTFLIDPWLLEKGQMGCFLDIPGNPFHVPDTAKEGIPMPMCALPEPAEEILKDVDFYIVTHIHPDHIDMAPDGTVGRMLDKTVPVLVQNETDGRVFRESGFEQVLVLGETAYACGDVSITRTPALHGVIEPCGEACGIIFQAKQEKTLYVAGDTIWTTEIKKTLQTFTPDVVVLNACAAELAGFGRLIMNDEDVEAVARTAPDAQIVISHMDTVAHASITRYTMRGLLAKRGVDYLMPEDGETLVFN
ncbi:MAG: MBL fold metallo-hydrolase [Succiniclasticum sp.]|jgi:L-ascorbate metabolism protein UlaG (beta-lactamase superfamily)|nr:hydrolase [Acidaminococcaceae bacterium]